MEELLTLPGVGRKTANLVLILAFKSLKNICVDTHVHRISNRLGWVRTRTPDETEQALYEATVHRWWPYINLYLVTWGQNVCRPVYPRCGACVLRDLCPRVGVAGRRGAGPSCRPACTRPVAEATREGKPCCGFARLDACGGRPRRRRLRADSARPAPSRPKARGEASPRAPPCPRQAAGPSSSSKRRRARSSSRRIRMRRRRRWRTWSTW